MLTLVPTPIGNLEDITLRAIKALDSAQVVLSEDTRNTKKLYSLYLERGLVESKPREFKSLHSHNETTFLESVDDSLFEQNVIYVSDAGMPGISDPGLELIAYCQKKGIAYDVLPGANAVLLAYVMSGFCEKEFLFFGFLPHKGSERKKQLSQVMQCGHTAILYESPHRIEKLLEELAETESTQQVFLVKELTKMHQKWWKGSAASMLGIMKDENLKGEWVVVFEGVDSEARNSLSEEEIKVMEIPPKIKAKLLSKITGENTKTIYETLIGK